MWGLGYSSSPLRGGFEKRKIPPFTIGTDDNHTSLTLFCPLEKTKELGVGECLMSKQPSPLLRHYFPHRQLPFHKPAPHSQLPPVRFSPHTHLAQCLPLTEVARWLTAICLFLSHLRFPLPSRSSSMLSPPPPAPLGPLFLLTTKSL